MKNIIYKFYNILMSTTTESFFARYEQLLIEKHNREINELTDENNRLNNCIAYLRLENEQLKQKITSMEITSLIALEEFPIEEPTVEEPVVAEPTVEALVETPTDEVIEDEPVEDVEPVASSNESNTGSVILELADFNTDTFFSIICPSRLKTNTTNAYRFHLRALKSLDEADLKSWVFDATPATYVKARFSLAKKIIKLFNLPFDIVQPEPVAVNRNKKRTNDDYAAIYNNWKLNIETDHLLTTPMNPYKIFAYFIPMRRNDIYSIKVVQSINDTNTDDNFYCKDEQCFVYNSYKTHDRYGQQILRLTELTPFIDERVIKRVTDYMDTISNDKLLFKKGVIMTHFNKLRSCTNHNIDELRHCWVERGIKDGNRAISETLAKWMAHAYTTAADVYRP